MLKTSYPGLADWIVASLIRYVERSVPTGDCLRAALENDFRGFFMYADEATAAQAQRIAAYLHNELPADCWGSREKVRAWLRGEEDLEDAP